MVVRQDYHCHPKTWLRILKEEKVVNKKELHPGSKKIFQFSKVEYLMERQPAFLLQYFLKIKTSAAKTIQSREVFHVLGMQIGWHIKNLAAMKIIAAADILVQE